jgi:hypothetical protein
MADHLVEDFDLFGAQPFAGAEERSNRDPLRTALSRSLIRERWPLGMIRSGGRTAGASINPGSGCEFDPAPLISR